MFQSFIIMVREGVEAALIIGILLVVLRQSGRRRLERAVFWGVGLAVGASVAAAIALQLVPLRDGLYEGTLYFVSVVFVVSMMWWMHRHARTLKSSIEQRVRQAAAASPGRRGREAWALGAFAFLMVFREGAETVMFLSAVNLTTDALLGFLGTVLGLIVAVVFAVMFVRGSVHANLRRFFRVTEWVLAIFVGQLLINGYHEYSEAGLLPATQRSMALIGPVVRNNSLFILAIVAIPLFLWISRGASTAPVLDSLTGAERRLALARARREHFYGYGAIATTLIVLGAVGVVYAHEIVPKKLPAPEPVAAAGGFVTVPVAALETGQLRRFGFLVGDRTVRFLLLKTNDGKVRTALDACVICGSFGYIQEGPNLICLNCGAEINPLTVGQSGGCNPIPLEAEVTPTAVRVRVASLEKAASLFPVANQPDRVEVDPVCGMQVKVSEAAAFEVIGGKTYYFCSEKCHQRFQQDHAATAAKKSGRR